MDTCLSWVDNPNFTCILLAHFCQKSIVPRFKSWIRKIVLEEDEEGLMKKNNAKPSIAEETAAAAKAAAAAAADVARASQEMLITKSEGRSLMISKSIYCSAVNTV